MEALLAPLFGGLASLLGGILVWALREKAHVQVTEVQERMIAGVVTGAVGIAEEAANKALGGLDGPRKLSVATSYASAELARLKLPALSAATLENRIHAQLGMQRVDTASPTSPALRLPSTLQTHTPAAGTQAPRKQP